MAKINGIEELSPYAMKLPYDVENEKAILGVLLSNQNMYYEISSVILSERFFYEEIHQKIYASMQDVFKNGMSVDLITVSANLQKKGHITQTLSIFYLTQLSRINADWLQLRSYASILVDNYIYRGIIATCQETINLAYKMQSSPLDVIASHTMELKGIETGISTDTSKVVGDEYSKLLLSIEQMKGKPYGLSGMDTGYEILNDITDGLQKNELAVLAARPAVGKTAFAINLAMNIAATGAGVLIFSLEMLAQQLVSRMASAKSGVEFYSVKTKRVTIAEQQELNKHIQYFSELNIKIEDKKKAYTQIESNIKTVKRKDDNLKFVIIDYLQLMQGSKKNNREQEIAGMTGNLKTLCNELEICILVLCQLNRDSEKAAKPTLAHLRESGAIEQDADMVMALYTEPKEVQPNPEKVELDHHVIILKNRSGETADFKLEFNKDIQRWEDTAKAEDMFPDNPSAGITNRLPPMHGYQNNPKPYEEDNFNN